MVAEYSPTGRSGPVTEAGIHRLLDLFYGRVRSDPLLGPVFTRAVGMTDAEWVPHLARLADFWSSLMLGSGRYHGDPFSAHLRLPDLAPAMFDRWLALFDESCREVFEPNVANAFAKRAERVARSLHIGLFGHLPATHARADNAKQGLP